MFETERLILRRFIESDFEDFFEMENSEVVMQFTGPGRAQTRSESLKRFNERFLPNTASLDVLGFFAVEHKGLRKVIGFLMIYDKVDESPELGFMINQSFWGQGYTSEFCKCICQHIKESGAIKKLKACVEPINIASMKVIERLGFTKVGERQITKGDKEVNLYDYELIFGN